MAWRRPGDKPLSEPLIGSLPTHICVTRPQWFIRLFTAFFHSPNARWVDLKLKIVRIQCWKCYLFYQQLQTCVIQNRKPRRERKFHFCPRAIDKIFSRMALYFRRKLMSVLPMVCHSLIIFENHFHCPICDANSGADVHRKGQIFLTYGLMTNTFNHSTWAITRCVHMNKNVFQIFLHDSYNSGDNTAIVSEYNAKYEREWVENLHSTVTNWNVCTSITTIMGPYYNVGLCIPVMNMSAW